MGLAALDLASGHNDLVDSQGQAKCYQSRADAAHSDADQSLQHSLERNHCMQLRVAGVDLVAASAFVAFQDIVLEHMYR